MRLHLHWNGSGHHLLWNDIHWWLLLLRDWSRYHSLVHHHRLALHHHCRLNLSLWLDDGLRWSDLHWHWNRGLLCQELLVALCRRHRSRWSSNGSANVLQRRYQSGWQDFRNFRNVLQLCAYQLASDTELDEVHFSVCVRIGKSPVVRNLSEILSFHASVITHHIWPKIMGDKLDFRKNPLA